ncbi:hypothetical protein [Burkholderia sp. Bp8991]|uniref:hypothetical protein n=1 Tax=Burkholderia sp. Bp8991 TaxID=2184553 RepID=UPI000F5AA764|nr:hypothetical protein [Burkholderia sp. Bp8991]RQS05566.1 hypothetical protein DIE02_16235 [Burkholderia sp. Bp8991]
MKFGLDNGGFPFECGDAKLSLGTSTWNTRLSQLARVRGPVHIMTRQLVDLDYIGLILGKRAENIFILAHTSARTEAHVLKQRFPNVEFKLHPDNNAKVVLVAPETVWLTSEDFGKSTKTQIDSGVGLHSSTAYELTLTKLFSPAWASAEMLF